MFLVLTLSLRAEVIHFRVVNGDDGKPVKDEFVKVWVNGSKKAFELGTRGGLARIDVAKGATITIAPKRYHDCRANDKATYSADEIAGAGVVTENTCGPAPAVKRGGELLLFVRPKGFVERLKP